MKKYISTSALVLYLCLEAAAQNYNAGLMHVNGPVYDASAASGSTLSTNSNLFIGTGGIWLLNSALITTPRISTAQTEVVKFYVGTYTRSSGYVNGYASAENQAAGFVLPIGHSSYMPLTVNSALASGSPITGAWFDNQPLASTNIGGVQYNFLAGYYDLKTTSAGPSVTATVPLAAIAATHLLGTVDGTTFTDLGLANSIVILPLGSYQLRFANSSSVLPVKLISFTASKQSTTAQLSWKISSEQALPSYTVERSGDGRSFSAIGFLPSIGNTDQERTYTLYDASPLKGANYYRLKITDADGTLSYSAVRVLNFDAILQLAVYPNPVHDVATISGLEPGMQVIIISMQGQQVIKQRASSNTIEINIKHLSSAVYQVQIQDFTGNVIGNYRIAKQ